jgi:hypothetical protein
MLPYVTLKTTRPPQLFLELLLLLLLALQTGRRGRGAYLKKLPCVINILK